MSEIKLGSEFYMKQTEGERTLVKVLWTGGYDSTYRIVELSRHDVVVQPYYLSDKHRHSEKFELDAISEITADIEKHPETRCKLLPLIKRQVSDLKPDNEILQAYERLRNISYLGPQYIWLAEFAKSNNGLELCIEMLDCQSGATYCIRREGELKKINEGGLVYWILNEEKSSRDIFTVFGSMHFPIIELSKVDMLEGYKQMGLYETMKKTWFCHTPVRGEPCGVCNPCKHVIKEGLSFRIPPAGMERHKIEIHYNNEGWFKYWKKIRYRIYGY